jgi:glutaminyl-tRNA synthetase
MTESNSNNEETKALSANFIKMIIDKDREQGKNDGCVHTRFPPEPNGYLHIGHAKSICLNFGLARDYNGLCNLRFDDTNPCKEEDEYVHAIKEDIGWLGFEWDDREFYASDYYETLYGYAVNLIEKGKAFVCQLNTEQIRQYRGTLKQPGKNSPYRDRSIEENLDLFKRMRAGEFEEGSHVLRAKIDMSSPNLNMRDPVMYRILKAYHHRTGNDWCIYPMYDFAHGQSDSIEGITHSICTLEFEDHRPLYDWFIRELEIHAPQQIEFARLNLNYTVMSKRKLLQLVEGGHVNGWNDPRMPTISGLRRRGYTPESIRDFADRIGVAKADSTVDIGLLEHCLREDLNKKAKRVMAILDPLKIVIENYPEDLEEEIEAVNNPEDESMGTRKMPFSREIYIERADFREDPPKKYFRLYPGNEVRLKHAYYITCKEVIKDENGEITELRCLYDPESRGGGTPDGRRVRGTLQWVSARHADKVEVRLYDHLFSVEDPEVVEEGKTYLDNINPQSLEVITAILEPGLSGMEPGTRIQFMRHGYFCVDPDSTPDKPIFNRAVSLRDSWAKIEKKMNKK